MTIHRDDAAPTPESDEQYVREVIDSAMSGSRPSLDLTAGALGRGRRLRTRRRLAVASTVAAAGVLAAVAAPWLATSTGSDPVGRSDTFVATQPPAPLPPQQEGWWDMPAIDMVNAVGAIVPDGVAVTDPGPLEADSPEGGPASSWINATLMAPGGPGRLNVMLYPDPTHTITLSGDDGTVLALDISCDTEHAGRTQCVQLRDAQGSVVGRRLTNRWGGTVMNEVVLQRAGGTVYAASVNTLDDKWGADSPLSADRPPLTLDQLEDLVRNDVWVSYRR